MKTHGSCRVRSSSSSSASSNYSRNQVRSSASSKRKSILFLPPSNLDMNHLFTNWQSRFHHVQQNVVPLPPADERTIGNEHGSDPYQDSQAHLSNEEFQRLMDEGVPGRSTRPHETNFLNASQNASATRSSLPAFSSAQTETPGQWDDSQSPYAEDQDTQRPVLEPNAKKRPAKNPVRKGKKTKATIDLSDKEDGVDAIQLHRWTDPKVSQLIAFRSEMDADFKQNAKKQGINTWEKLQTRMVAACDNFVKSPEACRKKWKAIYSSYCNDKRLLQISGEGRKVACKFFDEIDEGFNNASNVRKLCHGDARGTPNPCPPDLNDQWETQDSGFAATESDPSKSISPTDSKASKKSPTKHIASFMSQMVGHSADMVDVGRCMINQTSRIADNIHSNALVLKELQFNMAKLIEKL